MLHFQKDAPIFRRFALEIVNGNPKLLDVKKVGHDMDNSMKKGFGEIFRNAENMICIQHAGVLIAKLIQDLRVPDKIRSGTFDRSVHNQMAKYE